MLRGWLKAARDKVASVAFPANAGGFLRFLLPNTNIDFERHVGDGIGSNVFMSPILWIWRQAIESRMAVLTETADKEELDFQHELSKLLRNPNPFYSGAAMMLAILISWFTDGNVYLLKARDGSGAVRRLWYVPHWMVEPKCDESDPSSFISYYCYRPGGAAEHELLPSEVVHLKCGVDPRNVRKGFSHMKMLLREIFNDDESANFVAALLLNSGVPGLIISPKESSSAGSEDLKATRDYVQVMFGRSRRGTPLAIGAPTEIKEFGYDPNKMNLSGVRNVSEERICAGIGLPVAILGFGTGVEQTSVGATIIELHRIAWVGCIIPNQELIAEELTRSLREDFKLSDDQRISFDRDKVRALQEDRNKEAERLRGLVKDAVMMRSEARKLLRLEVTDEDEVYHLPLGVTLEGPGAPDPEPAPAAALGPDGKPLPAKPPRPGDPAPAANEPDPNSVEKPKAAGKRMSRQQVAILRAMDKIKERAGRGLERRMNEFFKTMGEAVEAAYLATRVKSSDDEIQVELVMGSIGVNKLRQEVRGIYATHYVGVFRETHATLAGMGLEVSGVDAAEMKILARGGTQAGLLDMTKDARGKALKILEQGRADGRNPEDIARDLAKAIPAGRFEDSRTRASLIARNETRVAQTESALAVYRGAAGIGEVMVIDGRLGETDDDCEAVNGQRVDFNTAEGLIADEHPNGTRDIVPVFGGA
ncbi:MAG: phage portal protein [Elusimicrobia bacterium]|nr:phage portal protein [Elusimicrobiota bacterium]